MKIKLKDITCIETVRVSEPRTISRSLSDKTYDLFLIDYLAVEVRSKKSGDLLAIIPFAQIIHSTPLEDTVSSDSSDDGRPVIPVVVSSGRVKSKLHG